MRAGYRLLLAWALAALASGATAQASAGDDALKSPACLAARERLDAIMAEDKPDIVRLRAARQRGARACFRSEADAERPSRADRPQMAMPRAAGPATALPVPSVPPRAPGAPTAATPSVPQPQQVVRCDAGGCWDGNGQRLNRAGQQLVNPQGRLCTQQGTVLNCP